ncbi:hypothetical protein HY496_02750 [Candidatus Woesearchaeota archaeon]|nr:hypothetical protein [Candidatus Woesearchaeota archaeon]
MAAAKTTTKKDYHILPAYDRRLLTHRTLCLWLVFCGRIDSRWTDRPQGGWRFAVTKHRGPFHRWFREAFGHKPTFAWDGNEDQPKLKRFIMIRKHATKFLRGALADGWGFGRRGWRIPEFMYQHHTLEVLQAWVGLKTSLFLFVTRKGNPDRTATTLKCQSMSKVGMTRLHQGLVDQGIIHTFAVYKKPYDQTSMAHPDKPFKALQTIVLYGLQRVGHLFQQLGWDSPWYMQQNRIYQLRHLLGGTLDESLQTWYTQSQSEASHDPAIRSPHYA